MSVLKNTLASLCLILLCEAAWSAQIHYSFKGTLFEVDSNGQPTTGTSTPWSASFNINTNTTSETVIYPDSSMPHVFSGESTTYSNLSGSITLGDSIHYNLASNGFIRIDNDAHYYLEEYDFEGLQDNVIFDTNPTNLTLDGHAVNTLRIAFQEDRLGNFSNGHDVLTSTSLLESTDLNRFDDINSLWIEVDPNNNTNRQFFGIISSTEVTINEVPLQSAAWSFGCALLGLGHFKRKR